MNEKDIASFWDAHPCGEHLIKEDTTNYIEFFNAYDAYRYSTEKHILRCLDEIEFAGKDVLEIGLGQGADSEQMIRRGAIWSGLDLTQESVNRVKVRLSLKNLPYKDIKIGSVLNIPYSDNSFDIVYSHGVLHHVPDILHAQKEINRVLKPDGELVIMLYAKYSLNYILSISLIRRVGLLFLYLSGINPGSIYDQHIKIAKKVGIWNYLQLRNFIHRNTDGPLNPYSKVYDVAEVKKDFPLFRIKRIHKEFMHAPPLPVHSWPGARYLGWHLWVHLSPKRSHKF